MENAKVLREVEEVAALLGRSNEYVRNQCRLKKIKSSKIGKRWMVPQQEVDRLLMQDTTETSSKTEIQIAKLIAENRAIKTQLEAVRSLLSGANCILNRHSSNENYDS